MDKIRIVGGRPLSGEIAISGAKNACLALMPAALLTDQPLTLTNAPRLADIKTMRSLLGALGCEVAALSDGRVLALSAEELTSLHADYEIVRQMRASILVLGPLLARYGKAEVSLPGGCAIGARPVNLHLQGLAHMGAELELEGGYVEGTVPGGRLKGAVIEFPTVSVGATENLMMAATLAKGTTVLKGAAREPEIGDLAACLTAMGARIEGAGTDTIEIEGVETLRGATHRVLPDRIELGTFMMAPAMAGGEIVLKGANGGLVQAVRDRLDEAGVDIEDTDQGTRVRRRDGLNPVNVRTEPFPGFPTDLQAQMMALLSLADGTSTIEETIFENRFMHVPELQRMGARVAVSGRTATVRGVEHLRGAPVMATDLRASVSLVLAGLAARGETTLSRVYHLDRGYEGIEQKLRAAGAEIERVREPE
ncbi:MAG TPA: UDP-N-acetylglucosamine 1-carboxyvinyltransferase [Thermohalobaculum sp.]|nr:UDP-N-acetylglucosamine 1-carboxyvinyltransferase [Thermohalobaculum sp.]